MIKDVKFIAMLTPADRYRHHHTRFRGDVISFTVQYETRLARRWLPVVRYDTQHGFAHRDLLDKEGNKRKTPIFTEDYSEALSFAEHDIRSNWKIYKQDFLGSLRDENTER